MKRILTLLVAIATILTTSAQSPEAIREALKQNPKLSLPTYSTYPVVEFAPLAPAPEGYTPFYISTVNRHGSRYQNRLNTTYFLERIMTLKMLEEKGLLTETGALVMKYMYDAENEQKYLIGELSPLGARQLFEMGERVDKRFGEVFDGKGAVVAVSSPYNRCIESAQNFIKGIQEDNPQLKTSLSWDMQHQSMLRPFSIVTKAYNQQMRQEFNRHIASGEWRTLRAEWAAKQDCSASLAQIVTNVERAEKVTGKNSFYMAYEIFSGLLFMQNFEVGESDLHTRLFSDEDIYKFYLYKTFEWNCSRSCAGIDVMELRYSRIRPMVEDIIEKADKAIKCDDVCMNLRCTHDTNVMPFIVAMGFEGTMPTFKGEVESCAVSTLASKSIPMGANVQLVFYRNNKNDVIVRALLNENDWAIPAETVAPGFYRWSTLRKFWLDRLDSFDKMVKTNSK